MLAEPLLIELVSGVNFIGTQRCTDCESSPIGQLGARAAEQGWTDVFTVCMLIMTLSCSVD